MAIPIPLGDDELAVLHKAAKTITYDGVEGINSAIERVGRTAAVGMLIVFLRREFNPNGGWPDPDDLTDRVNRVLASAGIAREPVRK